MIVVIFSAKLRIGADTSEYERLGARMYELVQEIPGFISVDSYPDGDRGEVTIVRFTTEEALQAWRTNVEHLHAQQMGRDSFYESYHIQVCITRRDYEFTEENGLIHHK